MGFLFGGLILLVSGMVLRRFLGLSGAGRSRAPGEGPLTRRHLAVFTPFATEVETQATIISVSLNDAIEERVAGRGKSAWLLVKISAEEWQRVAAILTALLEVLQKNLPRAYSPIPYEGMVVRLFKSRTMTDYLRMYAFLKLVVFRSHMRFQLQVRTLRGAVAALTRDFVRAYEFGERTGERPRELWDRLDIFTHDFDLLTKETLMAARALLVSLPQEELIGFQEQLKRALACGVRRDSVLTQL